MTQPVSTPPASHLTHQQLCDLLLARPVTAAEAAPGLAPHDLSADQERLQEHMQACLICASELELLRRSLVAFQASSIAVADRELARRSLPAHFASLYAGRFRRYSTPVLFWATTALLFAAVLPLSLFNSRVKTPAAPTVVTSSDSRPDAQASDAALLDSIDQDLSAAIPSPLTPLAAATDAASQAAPSDSAN